MQDVASVDNPLRGLPCQLQRAKVGAREQGSVAGMGPSSAEAAHDRVELSEDALNHDQAANVGRADEKHIAGLRAQIAADTYLTPDKIDAVVEELLAALRLQM